jgi:outer membrane protein, multidrug efflux system
MSLYTPFNKVLLAFGILFLFGCNSASKYQSPDIQTPCEWHSELSTNMVTTSPECFLWWESLNDPLLNSLIERAASQNLDMQIAATRVLEVRREVKGAGTGVYPHIDGSINYGNANYNQKVLNQILGQKHHKSHQHNINLFEVGFDADWEIDLFGKNLHERNAAEAHAESSEEEMRAIWVTLSAEVGKNYINLRGLQARLALIDKSLAMQKDTLQLNKDLSNTGFVNLIDQLQAEGQMNLSAAEKTEVELSITKTIYHLSILLGYPPGDLFAELSKPQSLPLLPTSQPIGIPSELLRRRPDIRKAERDLAMSTENVESAIASLFPRISLKGFIGDIATLCTGGFASYVGPQILFPIFNSKLLKTDVDVNKLKKQQAFYNYQKKVLEVLEEAETAIVTFKAQVEKNQFLSNAQNASKDANDFTSQLYQKGLKNYLEVLATEHSLLSANEASLQSHVDLLLHYISLYKALGGGWDIDVCSN